MKYKIQSNYQGKNNKRELANTEYRKFSRLKLHNNQLEGGIKNCKWRAHILQYLLLVSKRHFKTQGNFSLYTIYNVSFLPFFHTFFEVLESKHTIYLRQKRLEGKLNCPHKPLNVPHGFTLWWLFLSCLSSLMRLLMVSSTAIMDSWTVSWEAEVSLSLGGFSFKWEMNVLRTPAIIKRLCDGFKEIRGKPVIRLPGKRVVLLALPPAFPSPFPPPRLFLTSLLLFSPLPTRESLQRLSKGFKINEVLSALLGHRKLFW